MRRRGIVIALILVATIVWSTCTPARAAGTKGTTDDVQVDTSAGFKPPAYTGAASFPAPTPAPPNAGLQEGNPCDPPAGVRQVTPDLTGTPSQYMASYTQTINQPGHDPIRKTVGPVPIPSMAGSNAQYASQTAQLAVGYGSANQAMFTSSVLKAWEAGAPSPAPRDYLPTITAADYVPPAIPPPVTGAKAYADNIPEWNVKMGVNVQPGSWHQDYSPPIPAKYEADTNGVQQLVRAAVPPRPLGTWHCDGFDMAWDGAPPALADAVPAAPPSLAITGKPLEIADSVWKHWRAGTLGTFPSKDATTYVGIPTCVWIDNSGRPTEAVNIPSKSEVTGRALRGPVTITEYMNVNVTPEPVEWHFDDPTGHSSGFEAGRGSKPSGTPHYDAVAQTWPSPQNYCQVFHQYAKVRDQVAISATQWYDFKITGYFNNGAGRTELTPITYRLQARWDSSPLHVFQIEAVPFIP